MPHQTEARHAAGGAAAGHLDLSCEEADNPPNAPKTAPAQAEILRNPRAVRDTDESDPEIALTLAASGWRAAAILLTLTAQYAEAGEFLSAERNRRRAREQFIEANDAFRQVQEARAAAADWIRAQAFL